MALAALSKLGKTGIFAFESSLTTANRSASADPYWDSI